MERTTNYKVTAFLTVIAAIASGFVAYRQPMVRFEPKLDALPMRIGDWQGRDYDLDPGVRGALSADSILCRYYTDSRDRQVSLLVTYRKYGRRSFTHRPEMCYPAAGWEIIGSEYARIPYAGRSVRVRRMEAGKDGTRMLVTYWFASGRRTEASYVRQQMLMALDRLQPRKYGWAFIRTDVYETRGRKESLEATRDFMRDIGKPLAEILAGSD